MEKIKDKLNHLRLEADAAVERAEKAEALNKKLELDLTGKDQEILSLTHRLHVVEDTLEKTEAKLADAKAAHEDSETSRTTAENLQRKIQLLEEELDVAEKNVKETVEKLRQVDVKAEHFERQVQRAESERDAMEKKYEDALAKYQSSKRELDELVASMEGI